VSNTYGCIHSGVARVRKYGPWEMVCLTAVMPHSLRSWPCAGETYRSKVRLKKKAGFGYGPDGPSGSPRAVMRLPLSAT